MKICRGLPRHGIECSIKEPQEECNFHKSKNSCKNCIKIYCQINKERRNKKSIEWQKKNVDRVRINERNRYHKNPEKYRNKTKMRYKEESEEVKLRRKCAVYSISIEEYISLKLSQEDKCFLCGCKEVVRYKGKIRCLSIDHNHETGQVRGLLCNFCNIALGRIEDVLKIPGLLDKMLEYLKKLWQTKRQSSYLWCLRLPIAVQPGPALRKMRN